MKKGKNEGKVNKLISVSKEAVKSLRLKAAAKETSVKQYIETLVEKDAIK